MSTMISIGRGQMALTQTYNIPAGSYTIDLSQYATPEYRSQMKIPDTILGHEWALVDGSGSVLRSGQVAGPGTTTPTFSDPMEDRSLDMIFEDTPSSSGGESYIGNSSYGGETFGGGNPNSNPDEECEDDEECCPPPESSGGGPGGCTR
ncbi:MAG: hypothetical protein FWD31_04590, partial [Planctomycetaceae bacterium]|nr:hypothetical protein [Planctomycetaceae bacterium]